MFCKRLWERLSQYSTPSSKAQYENACQVFQNQQGLIILPTVDIDKLFTKGIPVHVCK